VARAAIGCCLIAAAAVASAEPVTAIRTNGASANRVDIVVLGDGYTSAQLASGSYAQQVETFVQGVFAQQPYREYAGFFNVWRIDVTSIESGSDHPESGTFKNTALDSTYNCGSIQRLICVNTTKVNAVLSNSGIAANARDIVLVLVNDATYGGSGGSVAVASTHASAIELILHEVGHSFGLLADEYGGPPPPSCNLTEPSAVNGTAVTSRPSIKWTAWIDAGTAIPTSGTAPGVPGLYQGAVYCDNGMYRPTYNSKMRSLGQPFDAINAEQHVRRIYNFASPMDSSSPSGSSLQVAAGQGATFGVAGPQPLTHNLDVTWFVNGTAAATGAQYTAHLPTGTYTIMASVHDATVMVRSDPALLLTATRSWTLTVIAAIPTLTINDVGVTEGQSGTKSATFTVSLSSTATTAATVNYVTEDVTGWSASRANTQAITIPTQGVASPYPSTITVPAGVGTITKATVVLRNYSHTYPSDAHILLVGPGGHHTVLMSGVGGGTAVQNATLTFDDAASTMVPAGGPIVSGTFRPQVERSVPFPAPAPVIPTFGPDLSAFTGSNPSGTWRLYVYDNAALDGGSLAGGWQLNLATTTAADYVPASGVLTFPIGSSSQSLSITINGDGAVEPAETFNVNLSNATNATITDSVGVGTILNDDILPFTDPTLTATSFVKAVHVTELRTRINAARSVRSLAAFLWTDPTLDAGSTAVKSAHFMEMRTALAQVYAVALLAPPSFTDQTLAGVFVKAVHIMELRAAVTAIE